MSDEKKLPANVRVDVIGYFVLDEENANVCVKARCSCGTSVETIFDAAADLVTQVTDVYPGSSPRPCTKEEFYMDDEEAAAEEDNADTSD